MARKYPKFLWSNPTITKSSGHFIIHTQNPRFIAKPHFDQKRWLYDTVIVEIWENDYDSSELLEVQKEIITWFNESGRIHSVDPDDKLICGLTQLEFLKNTREHFTVEQAQAVIRVIFPTKARNIYHSSSSYGLKHLFERISRFNDRHRAWKYCSNYTLIKAMELEGFRSVKTTDTVNPHFNLSSKEVKTVQRIFRG